MGCGIAIDVTEFIQKIEKAVAGGVATLDSSAKVPKSQINLTPADVGAIATETDPTVPEFVKNITTNEDILAKLNAAAGTISASLLPSYVADAAVKLNTARTISSTGDAVWSVTFDGSVNVSAALTLATVNSNTGTFGSGTQTAVFAVDNKGRITGVTNTTITPAYSSLTGVPSNINYLANTANNPPNWHVYVPTRNYGAELVWTPATINSSIENTIVLRSANGSITAFNGTFNGEALISSSNAATNLTTGALRVPNGGASIGGNVYVGGNLNAATYFFVTASSGTASIGIGTDNTLAYSPSAIELPSNTAYGGTNTQHTGIRICCGGMIGWGTAQFQIYAGTNWKTYTTTPIFTAQNGSIRIPTASAPSSATAGGTIGTICWDTAYIYVCTATNTWKRVALSAW